MRIEQATRNDVPDGELDELKRELVNLQKQLEDEET